MALKNFSAKIMTSGGVRDLGQAVNTDNIYDGDYNMTWAAFLTHIGYNGGLYNLTWATEKPVGTYEQTILLNNGNYVKEHIENLYAGDNPPTRTFLYVDFYNSNNTLAFRVGTVNAGYRDKEIVLIMYDDSNNTLRFVQCFHTAGTNNCHITILSTGYPISTYLQWYGNSLAPADPYGTEVDNTPEGGYGPWDFSSDDVLPPSLPTVSAAQVGFVSLWNPSAQEMKDLADYLWTGTFDLTNFRKLFTDPMECVLSVGIIPVTPTTGTAIEIIFGGSSHSGVNAKPITNQFVTKDMGSLHIEGKSASFMDYSPYAKASIFLPYCGTYALDVDEIMDADIALEYHIDIYTGACVAYLTITRTNSDGKVLHSTLYQFTGNVLSTIPITGADHSSFLQSLLFMGASIAATVATAGGAAPEIGGAMASGDAVAMSPAMTGIAAGSAINTVMSMKPNVMHSGNLSSTAGFLGQQKPFITMTWSNLCRPDDEQKLVGLPLYKSGTLSDFEGFTVVDAVHMNNILCTDAELKMIEHALYKGVIV